MNSPYHHGDLRRQLTETGLALLEDEGLAALSLREVARRAGVSAMAPYRHFPDKQALLTAVAEHGFDQLGHALRAAERPDPRQSLVEEGVAYVRFAEEHRDLFKLMFGNDPLWRRREPSDLAKDPDTVYGRVARRVAQLADPADFDLSLLAAWSFLHGLAHFAADGLLAFAPADGAALRRQVSTFFVERVFR